MTDDELLARYRTKHGNPYMPLSVAKKMRRLEIKYAHLGAAARRRRDQAREEERRRLRDTVFGPKPGENRDV